MHLVENAPFNRGADKVYRGVMENLVAYACKFSFQHGQEGNVAFLSKTRLVKHYTARLGAVHIGGNRMLLDTAAALMLINRYFN